MMSLRLEQRQTTGKGAIVAGCAAPKGILARAAAAVDGRECRNRVRPPAPPELVDPEICFLQKLIGR